MSYAKTEHLSVPEPPFKFRLTFIALTIDNATGLREDFALKKSLQSIISVFRKIIKINFSRSLVKQFSVQILVKRQEPKLT